MKIALIAAVAANGVIGADGEIPWHIPEDLARFKETTMGHPVILGRRTYASIAERLGGPLPGRTNIVLSSGDPDLPETVVHASSVDAGLEAARQTGAGTVYVAGGATVYEQFLPMADRLVLTELADPYDGDTYFPDWDRGGWCVASREDHDGYAFVEYNRCRD